MAELTTHDASTDVSADVAESAQAPAHRRVRYSAFISYNHRDRRWAAWLHRKLERYRFPDPIVGRETDWGRLEKRLPPVFQDRQELAASADLAVSVREALAESANLIVICSTNGAQSRWVNQEVREFSALHGRERVQCLIVPEADGSDSTALPASQLFPPALLELGVDPLAADARPSGDGPKFALLKLVAGLVGVRFDELRQREQVRRHRQLLIMTSAAVLGFLLMSALAAFALVSRFQAVRERDIAREKTITAQRTTDFVKSLFQVADPSEAKGSQVTVREAVDRGARQIQDQLSNEPDTKAELLSTLSEVYIGLGAYRQADDLIRRSLALPVRSGETRARQLAVLAGSLALQGEYERAIGTYRQAQARLPREQDIRDPHLGSDILLGQAEALAAVERYSEARALIRTALARSLKVDGPQGQSAARALEAAGFTDQMEGEFGRARAHYQRALQIRRLEGDLHPKVSQNLSELGTVAYLQGDSASAEIYWRQALARDERVLGPDHQDLGATLNNLARVLLEQRKYREAAELLQRSANIYLAQRTDTHDDLAYIFSNLALARAELGGRAEAEQLMRRALTAAEVHNHRSLAPILVDLADLRCEAGDFKEAQGLLDRAAPIMAETYPDDPWRTAWLVNTRGACLVREGQRAEGARLLRMSAPVVLKRWSPATAFGWKVRQRMAKV